MSDSVRAGCSRVLEATAMKDFDGKMQALNDAVQNHFNVAAQGKFTAFSGHVGAALHAPVSKR